MFNNNNNQDLYKVLGVSKDADEATIKKSYRKMALKYHPDRNKDNKEESEARFKEISKAYEVLSDKSKRKMYDSFGMDAVNNGASSNMGENPFDIFGNIFSQSNGFDNVFNRSSGGKRRMKSSNVVKKLDITLEDIYCKRCLNISFDKTIKCKKCKGSGAKDSSSLIVCKTCDGSGITISIKTFGPGMISQSQSTCNSCHGQGKIIKEKCDKCKGSKYDISKKKINIQLDHAKRHKDKMVIGGEAHEDIDCELSGDLILEINVKDNKDFRRNGNNLHITKTINLVDSLCGFDLTITHLDNRKLLVKTGDIICPKTMKKIKGEGFNGGDMVIDFDILFPKTLSKERKEYISKLLPMNKKQDINYDDYELKILENYEYSTENSSSSTNIDDEPEEGNIGCATQ